MHEKRESTINFLTYFKIVLGSTDMSNAVLPWIQVFGNAKGLGDSREHKKKAWTWVKIQMFFCLVFFFF